MDFDSLKNKANDAISDVSEHTDSASDGPTEADVTEEPGADDQIDYQNQPGGPRPTAYQNQPDGSDGTDYQNQPDSGDHRGHRDEGA